VSKLLMFDFRCQDCGNTFDDLVKSNIFEAPCPECSGNGTRLISTPRFDPRMGLDPEGNPTAGEKWAKIRRQRAKQEKAHFEKHGTDMTPGADISG
jgi:putative FmdB family regulatory protein